MVDAARSESAAFLRTDPADVPTQAKYSITTGESNTAIYQPRKEI
jgi:hypothetical protein